MSLELNTGVQFLKGVGEKRAAKLSNLGVRTVGDLIEYYPFRYEDWATITPIADADSDVTLCVRGRPVYEPIQRITKSGRKTWVTDVSDSTGSVEVLFFSEMQTKKLSVEKDFLFYGKMSDGSFKRIMFSPATAPAEDREMRLRGVYHLTAGLYSNVIAGLVRTALDVLGDKIPDILPPQLVKKYKLLSKREALEKIHFPRNAEELRQARRRLIYEELFVLMCSIDVQLARRDRSSGHVIKKDLSAEFARLLPFELTDGQKDAIADIARDMASGRQMRRLIQGDVGSGKTAVAAAAVYNAVKNGFQAAVLAPTLVLASQTCEVLRSFFEGAGISVELVTGATAPGKKKKIAQELASGGIDVAVGTHALLSEDLTFGNLGLVVTDEQHRFGTDQRAAMLAKGRSVHSLVMSATPIPRTLGLILYGDLDVSVIPKAPSGRQKISTYIVDGSYERRVRAFIAKQCAEGHQVYVVCPAVDAEEDGRADVDSVYKELRSGELASYGVGLLHGRMRPAQKDKVMSDFRDGVIKILVCTVVIEVGVDVPGATLMVVKNSELFGLAQLHQLRGRVGRGAAASYCVLMSDDEDNERLEILKNSSDGFAIADEDLRLRGPGQFLGTAQWGDAGLKLADLVDDMNVLRAASADAKSFMLSGAAEAYPALLDCVKKITDGKQTVM